MKLVTLAKKIHYNMIRDYFLILQIEDLDEFYIVEAIDLVKANSEMLSSSYTEHNINNELDFHNAIEQDKISLSEALTNIAYMVMERVITMQNKGTITGKIERAIRPLINYLAKDVLDNFDVREKVRIMNLLS